MRISTRHPLLLAPAFFIAVLLAGCDQTDFRRGEMNPRKEAIYAYASGLQEVDENLQVTSTGAIGRPTNHPSRLRTPYPTRSDMEAAIGKADQAETQRVSYPIIGGLGEEEEEDNLALIWWEKDSTWEKYGKNGMEKAGHREIITAWFGPDGQLKKLYIMLPYGSEFIGRDSYSWKWYGSAG